MSLQSLQRNSKMARVKSESALYEVLDDIYCAEVSEKVFKLMRFPVDVAVIKANGPEFAKILVKLTDKLTTSCVSKQVTLELKEATTSLREAHQSCMAREIFVEELVNAINNLDEESDNCIDTKQFYCDIKKAMSLYKAMEIVADDPEKLKLHKHLLQLPVGAIKITPPVNEQEGRKLVALLQRRFQNRCEELLEIVNDATSEEHSLGTETMADIAIMLPKMIAELLQAAVKKNQTAWSNIYKNQSILRYYQDVLLGCINNLEHMVNKVRENQSFAADCEYLVAKSETCLNKLKLLEVTVQREIYSPGNVKALKKFSKCLQGELEETEEELAQVNYKLAGYSNLGVEFQSTVKEYSNLLKQIEDKQWTITELENHYAKNFN